MGPLFPFLRLFVFSDNNKDFCISLIRILINRQQELVANIKAPKRHGTRSNNNSNEDLSNR